VLTSQASGGRSVGTVRSRTQATELGKRTKRVLPRNAVFVILHTSTSRDIHILQGEMDRQKFDHTARFKKTVSLYLIGKKLI
jgi:hypothetical protein